MEDNENFKLFLAAANIYGLAVTEENIELLKFFFNISVKIEKGELQNLSIKEFVILIEKYKTQKSHE